MIDDSEGPNFDDLLEDFKNYPDLRHFHLILNDTEFNPNKENRIKFRETMEKMKDSIDEKSYDLMIMIMETKGYVMEEKSKHNSKKEPSLKFVENNFRKESEKLGEYINKINDYFATVIGQDETIFGEINDCIGCISDLNFVLSQIVEKPEFQLGLGNIQ